MPTEVTAAAPASQGTPVSRVHPSWKLWLLYLTLPVLVAISYSPALKNDFLLYDDPDYVTENRKLLEASPGDIVQWAFSTSHAGNWHPLTWLSHYADVKIFGLKASGHHAQSMILHALNCLLILYCFRALTNRLWESFFLAAIFAVHPLHVESVAWVAERKDVLSLFFFLLALIAYNGWCRSDARSGRWTAYVLSLMAFACGLMSKPMLVTFPFVLLLLDYWPLCRKKKLGLLLVEKFPFLILSLASCFVTFRIQQRAGAVSSLEALTPAFRVTNALVAYATYLWKTFWPVHLSVFYPAPKEWPFELVAGAAVLLAVISAAIIVYRQTQPWLWVGWCWFLGTLVPVIGLVQVGRQAMADRYTYLPQLGLLLGIIWLASNLAGQKRPRAGLLGLAFIAALGVLCFRQTLYWKDNETLFRHAIAVTAPNAVAENNLGVSLLNRGEMPEAEEHFTRTVQIQPKYPEARVNWAVCLEKRGKTNDAFVQLEQAVKLLPTPSGLYNLANMLSERGDAARAAENYQAALRLKPDLEEALFNYGLLEQRLQHWSHAEELFRNALRLKPGHIDVWLNLGSLLAQQQRWDESIQTFQKAIQLAPQDPNAHFDLASALNTRGHFAEAAREFAEVSRLRPDDLEAREQTGMALLSSGQAKEAAQQFRLLNEQNPTARSSYLLGLALDAGGDNAAARVYYEKAVSLDATNPLYLNDLAWALATHSTQQEDLRRAVQYARQACTLAGERDPRLWGTLDTALAALGKFDEAIQTADKTIELARSHGQTAILEAAQTRKKLYQNGQPYRLDSAAP